jgi:hypothetical protein
MKRTPGELRIIIIDPSVEAGSNTSIVALQVVRGDENGTQCLRYNWVTLFMGDINTRTSPSRLGEPRI